MGPEAARERALRYLLATGIALGWLALAAMLALGSTGVQVEPAPSSADTPAPLASDR